MKTIVDKYDTLLVLIQRQILEQFFAFLIGCLFLYSIDKLLSFLIIAWSIIFFIIMFFLSFKFNKLCSIANKINNNITGLTGDIFANIQTLFFYGSKKFEFQKIEKIIDEDFYSSYHAIKKYYMKSTIIGDIFFLSMTLIIFFYVLYFYFQKKLTEGDMIFVMTSFYYIVGRVWTLADEISKFLLI